MSDDIAVRLRLTAEHFERAAKTKEQQSRAAEIASELREAADEISRLRNDNVTILSGG
jgi:hypothetical protein